MPVINVKDNGNNRWKRKGKKTKTKETSYSESVRAKWFCCAFKECSDD